MALGDADNDGNLDILLANVLTGDIGLLLGNGDGTFQATQRTQLAETINAVLIASLGKPAQGTSLVSGLAGFAVSLDFLQIGASGVAMPFPALDRYASGLVVADLNQDGWPDLLAAGSNIAFYLGGPSGFSALPVVSAGVASPTPLADFNEDGIPDLVATSNGMVELFIGNGDGTFAAGQVIVSGESLFVGDLNEDGHQDLLVLESTGYTELLGTGKGSFTQGSTVARTCVQTYFSTSPMYLLDLDGDGHLDLVELAFVDDGWGIKVELGNGDGTFQPGVAEPSIPADGSGVFGDLNNDGCPDLVVPHWWSDGNVDVFLNQCR